MPSDQQTLLTLGWRAWIWFPLFTPPHPRCPHLQGIAAVSPTGDIPAIRAPKPRGLKQTFILGFNNPENLLCRGVWVRILCILEQFLCRDGSGKTLGHLLWEANSTLRAPRGLHFHRIKIKQVELLSIFNRVHGFGSVKATLRTCVCRRWPSAKKVLVPPTF